MLYIFCSAKTYSTRQCCEHDPCNPLYAKTLPLAIHRRSLNRRTSWKTFSRNTPCITLQQRATCLVKFWSICRNLLLAPQSPQSPPKRSGPSAHNHSLANPQAMNKHIRSSRTDDQNMMECLQESFGHIIKTLLKSRKSMFTLFSKPPWLWDPWYDVSYALVRSMS